MSPQTVQVSGQSLTQMATATGSASSSQNITPTSSATAAVLLTAGPAEFAGGTYDVAFFAPAITKGTTNVAFELWVDGAFSRTLSGLITADQVAGSTYRTRVALDPGVHTLTVRAYVDGGTGVLVAGNGATGNRPNALLTVQPG